LNVRLTFVLLADNTDLFCDPFYIHSVFLFLPFSLIILNIMYQWFKLASFILSSHLV
jgi:hypothetical protein